MGAITPRYIKHLGKKLTESEVGPRYLGETGDSLYVPRSLGNSVAFSFSAMLFILGTKGDNYVFIIVLSRDPLNKLCVTLEEENKV